VFPLASTGPVEKEARAMLALVAERIHSRTRSDAEELMGFLPKKWLRALWGVNQPTMQFDPPIDCERCRIARQAGKDACPEHHHHARPHTYHMGHQIEWGGIFDNPQNAMPRYDDERISATSSHSIH
jgi:hypothetical protein